MTVIIDGTAGITFPSGSGTQAAQSKVLQVVQAYTNSGFTSTSSTSYVATTLSASITPLFSTSKVLIMLSGGVYNSSSSNTAYYSIYKNGSILVNLIENGAGSIWITLGGSYLDSPATTSAITYALYYKSTVGSAYWGGDSPLVNSITLMEIAA